MENQEQRTAKREKDRSHFNLAALDAVAWSYPGWEADFRDAEDAHYQGSRSGRSFQFALRKMKTKQRVHDGDRSHPRLKALDSLVLTYNGCNADVTEALNFHFNTPYYSSSDFSYRRKLEAMRRREALHITSKRTVGAEKIDNDSQSFTFGCSKAIPESAKGSAKTRPVIDGIMALFRNQFPRENIVRENPKSTSDKETGMSSTTSASPERIIELLGYCVVCQSQSKSHLFAPCGHLCVCVECAQKVMRRTACCPVCRGQAFDTIHVFL